MLGRIMAQFAALGKKETWEGWQIALAVTLVMISYLGLAIGTLALLITLPPIGLGWWDFLFIPVWWFITLCGIFAGTDIAERY